jgi:hypothetical protein
MPRARLPSAVGAALLSGCFAREPLLIEANVDADVTRLNPEQGEAQSLGPTPLRLADVHGTYVLKLSRPGYVSQLMILTEAETAQGSVKLSLTKLGADGEPVPGLGRRLDLALRAHRAFLRGHFGEMKALLQLLETQGGAGAVDFATLVLEGNLALVEGRITEAGQYYARAKALVPESDLGGLGL